MPPQNDAAEVIAAISAAMRAIGAAWYVFGAQAVVLYGRPRMTADVDVTALVAPEDATRLIDAMGEAGFEVGVEDVESFVAQTRVLPFAHRATRMPVDVVLAGPGLEMEFLGRVRRVGVGGLDVPVISPEDLVVTKVLAGRPKDLEDARGVLREQGAQLDVGRVRALLGVIEEALDRSDLVTELDRIVAEVRAPKKKASRKTSPAVGPRKKR